MAENAMGVGALNDQLDMPGMGGLMINYATIKPSYITDWSFVGGFI